MPRLFYYQFEVTAENRDGSYKQARFDIRAPNVSKANDEVQEKAQVRFPEAEGFFRWDALPTATGA
jgi:hypothetical protein